MRVCKNCGIEFETFGGKDHRTCCSRRCGIERQVEGRRGKKRYAEKTPCSVVGCRRVGHRHACSVPECPYPRYNVETGYCRGHLNAFRETGDPLTRREYARADRCSRPGCPAPHRRNGLCVKHSAQRARIMNGTVRFPPLPKVSIGPLVDLIHQKLATKSVLSVAADFGVESRTVHRWLSGEVKGIRRSDAENICDRLDLHPAMLWDDWLICKHGQTECDKCGYRVAA